MDIKLFAIGLLIVVVVLIMHQRQAKITDSSSISNLKVQNSDLVVNLDGSGSLDVVMVRSDGVYLHRADGKIVKIMGKKGGLTPYHVTMHDFNRSGNPDFYIRQKYDQSGQEGPAVIVSYQNNSFVENKIDPQNLTLQTSRQSDSVPDGHNFISLKFPKTVDWASARVAVMVSINGRTEALVKYNEISSEQDQALLTFDLGSHSMIDKIKIRTIYNKDYVYLEPQINTILEVDQMTNLNPDLGDRYVWGSMV